MSFYYAVRVGRVPGVYKDWPSCQKQVVKFPKARFKKFPTESEAWDFVHGIQRSSSFDDEPFSSWSDQPVDFDDPVISSSNKNSEQYQTTSASSKCQAKYTGQSTASEAVDMLRATAKTLKSTAMQLLKGADSVVSVQSIARQLMKGLDILNTQIDKVGSQKSATASFSAGGSVPSYPKRSYSDFTSLGGAGGSHDGNFKNDAAKSCKRMKSDPSGCTDHGFTGVPFPDHQGMVVYTDGASFDNGHATARAGIGIYWGPHDPFNKSERLSGRQTNNRAEIHAAEVAVLQAKQRGIKNLILYTDSQFLINGITIWIKKWKRNGWKLSTGGDVINRDDFEKLDEAISGINIKWMHVRGHRGIEGNEAADRLANVGAAKPLV